MDYLLPSLTAVRKSEAVGHQSMFELTPVDTKNRGTNQYSGIRTIQLEDLLILVA
jgi:hypothetical protein